MIILYLFRRVFDIKTMLYRHVHAKTNVHAVCIFMNIQRDIVCIADDITCKYIYMLIMIIIVGKSLMNHSLQKRLTTKITFNSIKYQITHVSYMCPYTRLILSMKHQVSNSPQGRYRLAIDERCSASVHEVTPRCEHFAEKCGGCAFQNLYLSWWLWCDEGMCGCDWMCK